VQSPHEGRRALTRVCEIESFLAPNARPQPQKNEVDEHLNAAIKGDDCSTAEYSGSSLHLCEPIVVIGRRMRYSACMPPFAHRPTILVMGVQHRKMLPHEQAVAGYSPTAIVWEPILPTVAPRSDVR
jgi:hypothetical protein